MKYIRFIAAFIAFIATTSCFVDNIEQIEVPSESRDDITVVARVARFDDHVVDTRGTKNEAEANVTCMAVAIFPIVNNKVGDCVFYDFRQGNQLLFTINRQEMKDGAYIYNTEAPYVMYVFANLPSMTEEACAGKSLAQMKAMAYSVNGVNVPENGFPMIGSLGDTITPEGDGKEFILKPGTDTNPTLPTVDTKPTDLLNVPMKSMFAKVNFTIKVTPDQTVDTHLTPQFTLDSYTVHNVPASVDFAMGGGDRLGHSVTDDITTVIGPFVNPMPLLNDIKIARGTQTINFTFYLPERYLTPTYQSHDGSKDGQNGYYDYPFPVVDGKYRPEDLSLRQRFKPLLPEGQDATYVTIKGKFFDHQQHEFDVTYNVYLGEDNYGNFDTERNSEYFHYVTIRGILNSDDQVNYGEGEMPVSIDHRVDIERVDPIIINLRRETLLDSHFEVRPLRIRKNPAYTGDLSKAKVKVEVVYAKQPTQKWIGLERSFGNGTQITNSIYLVATDLAADRQNSKGKRKYFTTDLTYYTLAGESQKDNNGYSTSGGQSVVVPVTTQDEAVWIYVDEALVAEAADAIRTATIRVSVAEDGENYGEPIDYVIQQRQLFPVTYGGNTYLIEYEEEYLHNFDASDSYGQTEDNGMEWGLNMLNLSNKHSSLYVNDDSIAGMIINALADNDAVKYDFYLTTDTEIESGTKHDYYGVGHEFSSEIISSATLPYMSLGDEAKSAVQYCYSKNKIMSNGSIDMMWYMPSIKELEDIMMGNYTSEDGTHKVYTRFIDFQGKPYWSSQPAYERNYIDYDITYIINYKTNGWYYCDDIDRARATQVSYSGSYSTINSGVTPGKYSHTLYMRDRTSSWSPKPKISLDPVTERGKNGLYTEVENESFYQPGNLPRTSKARVRCVRKM